MFPTCPKFALKVQLRIVIKIKFLFVRNIQDAFFCLKGPIIFTKCTDDSSKMAANVAKRPNRNVGHAHVMTISII